MNAPTINHNAMVTLLFQFSDGNQCFNPGARFTFVGYDGPLVVLRVPRGTYRIAVERKSVAPVSRN